MQQVTEAAGDDEGAEGQENAMERDHSPTAVNERRQETGNHEV